MVHTRYGGVQRSIGGPAVLQSSWLHRENQMRKEREKRQTHCETKPNDKLSGNRLLHESVNVSLITSAASRKIKRKKKQIENNKCASRVSTNRRREQQSQTMFPATVCFCVYDEFGSSFGHVSGLDK